MKEYMKVIAGMMAVAARTAPKSAGQDYLTVQIIDGKTLLKLGDAMADYGAVKGKKNFDRDGYNVKNSDAVVLIGLKNAKAVGLNCGACGYKNCKQLPHPQVGPELRGPYCALRLMDLGIALGAAVKTASILNADNRIMYRIGVVARQMKLTDADIAIGIPISATGKNIYFDRG